MTDIKVNKPKRPVNYSRYNYPTFEDYEEKMRIYEQSLAIYNTFNQDSSHEA